jgi:hypothetical protein
MCIVRHANPLLLLQQARLLSREETQVADVTCSLSSGQISSGHVRSDCYCLLL